MGFEPAGVSAGVAFAAGVLSFVSPCVLPLIPSYLSFLSGSTLAELQSGASRGRVFTRSAFFVLGFSLVFITLGALFSVFLGALGRIATVVNIVAGIVVIVLGLNFVFDFLGVLDRERRAHVRRRPAGIAGAFLVGMAFAAGWAPCVGPILSSILLLAGTQGALGNAVALLSVYSLGLGLPFLVAGLSFSRARRILDRLRPHMRAIKTGGGLFLVGMGVLIAFGRLQRFNILLFGMAGRLRAWDLAEPDLARWLFAGILALPAVAVGIGALRRRALSGGPPQASLWKLRPVAAGIAVALGALAALTAMGTLRPTNLLAVWLSYQGI